MNIDNLEKMIQQYSKQLLEMGKTYGGEGEKKKEISDEEQAQAEAVLAENMMQQTKPVENIAELSEPVTAQAEVLTEKKEPMESDSSATFIARVFAAEGAYPVSDAKVVVYNGDKIYAFLVTDENGNTKTVTLPAFNRETPAEKDEENATADYLADVFAKGFESKKGLIISAEGQSEIVLDVLLTPESERIS